MEFIGVHQTHCANALTELVNAAYRGTTGLGRWTTEHSLIAGNRIDTESIVDLIMSREARVFAAFDDNDNPRCCISVQLKGTMAEFGTFAVHPEDQGQGVGSKLLKHAENYAQKHANLFQVSVVNKNTDLINYYFRRGYHENRRTLPFPNSDKVGKPLRDDIFLVMLEKRVDIYG